MVSGSRRLLHNMTVDVGRIGVWVGRSFWPDDENAVGDAAAELERLGYQALWFGGATADLARPEQALAATTTLVAATGIVNVWFESASDVAASYRRVNDAYPNRLLVGIGAGHAPSVEASGQHYDHPYSKVVDYLDELERSDPPIPREHRALAALGPRTIRLAGERSAGAHPYLVNPWHTGLARDILGSGPLLAPEQKVVLVTARDAARAIAQETLSLYLGLPNYVSNLLRIGFTEDDVAGLGSDRLFDGVIAWGDLDAISRRVQEHHDAGADHVCVQVLTGRTALPFAEWRELAPALTA